MAAATTEQNISEITRAVNILRLPVDKLIIVGGAAMQMLGIKEWSRDIDAVVDPITLMDVVGQEQLQNHPWWRDKDRKYIPAKKQFRFAREGQPFPDRMQENAEYGVVKRGDITLMLPPNDELYQATYEDLRAEALLIGELLVSPPERILEWKQALRRPKDEADIALLQARIAATSPEVEA